jgi:hypothetical protein
MLVIVAIGLIASLMARAGLGTPARLFFVFAGLAVGCYYIARSPWQYITASFWFWTLTPCFRRIVDYYVGFDPVSMMLATPSLMTIIMLKEIIQSPTLLQFREARIGLFVAIPLFYGMFVNLVMGDLLPGAVAAADWLAPLLYYFYFLAAADRIDEAEPHFRTFFTINLIVTVVYGLYQCTSPTVWDTTWIRESGLIELGGPLPYTIRLFGTLNMPGPLAVWVSTLLLLSLHFRTKLMLVALPAASILLLLTLVRGAVATTAIGLIAAVLLGNSKVFWPAAKGIAVLSVITGN